MPKSVFEKIAAVLLLSLPLLAYGITPVSAAVVPSTNYPYLYDTEFSTPQAPYVVVHYARAPQNLPDGSWYPNLDFDSDWFLHNVAGYDTVAGIPLGTATLAATSTSDLIYGGGRGWSNSFIHQGRPPYTGVQEGHFKAGTSSSNAVPVDGIRYVMNTAEPTGKHYLTIRVQLTKSQLNSFSASNGLLICFIFQYEFSDGSLSAYDSPPFSAAMQSCHVDVFLHRTQRVYGIPVQLPTWSVTRGDAYNGDIHLQYHYNTDMTPGTWYTFTIDYGALINQIKGYLVTALINYNLPVPQAIILKYIQISTETIGGEISATVDYCRFTTS